MVSGTSAKLFGLLGHIFGKEVLEDIAVFFQHFKELCEGFKRATAAEAISRDAKTGRTVSSPTEPATEAHVLWSSCILENAFTWSHCQPVSSSIQQYSDVESTLLGHCERLNEGLATDTPNRMVARICSAHKRLGCFKSMKIH